MVMNREPVEERGNRQCCRQPRWRHRSLTVGAFTFLGEWMFRGRLRPEEHDFINAGETHIRLVDNRLYLVGWHVDERCLVADLRDYCLANDGSTDKPDLLGQALVRSCT